MGNKSSNAATTSEMVNFQKLDKHFSQKVISEWMKGESIDIQDYLLPVMALYGNYSSVDKNLDVVDNHEFQKHLRKMLDYHMNSILGKPVRNAQLSAFVAPKIQGKLDALTVMDIAFLQSILPENCRSDWKVRYNSSLHGESYAQFLEAILKEPSKTLIIIQSGSSRFGAFMSEPWFNNPGTFYGSSDNFLFDLKGKDTKIYKPSYYNENFAYLSIHSKSSVNGIGFGGQLEYFGIYFDHNFNGYCFAKPISATYNSPQFTESEKFKIDHLEVVSVFDYDKEEFFAKNPNFNPFGRKETMEFLELAGIEMHSKSIPPPINKIEEPGEIN